MSSRNSSFPKGHRSNRSGASPGVQNSSSDYDSDSEDEDDGSIPGPPARLRHLFVDEDESD